MAIKSLSIRIDTEMLDKLHVVADYEGRSANSQINILIRDCVAAYEKEHGQIVLGKQNPAPARCCENACITKTPDFPKFPLAIRKKI